jgi:hypothetical protein
MKILLDVKDHKAHFMIELLKSFSFVKAQTISDEKALLIKEIREGIENLNLVREGKIKSQSARSLLDEL